MTMSTETQSTGAVVSAQEVAQEVVAALTQTTLVELADTSRPELSKAYKLMQAQKSVKERADKYASRISKNLVTNMLDPLAQQIEAIEDAIFDLENICLETNLNKGMKTIDQPELEARFASILELNYKKDLLQAEYNSKANAFNRLFGQAE